MLKIYFDLSSFMSTEFVMKSDLAVEIETIYQFGFGKTGAKGE